MTSTRKVIFFNAEMILFFFGFISCFHLSCADFSNLTTEYYTKLISERITEATSYQLPLTNSEFIAGVNSTVTNDFGSFHFIIVGAGSAGSVLATRLSEIDSWNILLLEAGNEEDDFGQIPSLGILQLFSEKNWGYYTTPQESCCLSMNGRQCLVPTGKGIGGTSSINGMVYSRGNRYDYDNWAKLGNFGWSYKDVLPYFIKSENSQIDGDYGYHGKGGLWNVQYSFPNSQLFSKFFQATAELNATILDYNGREQIGSSQPQFNIKHGRRQSTGTAFLDMARRRKNLKVLTSVLVTRIIIDPVTRIAKGVEFVTKNQKFQVLATREVIVSAGAINSPQLLMLSGIGPRNHLEEMGIKPIVDLPVGENLMEQPLFSGLVFKTNYTYPGVDMEEVIRLYYRDGLGPFTRASGNDGIFFIHTSSQRKEVPSVEVVFVPPSGGDQLFSIRIMNTENFWNENFLNKINTTSDFTLYLSLLHPKSKGRITLTSTCPLDFPKVDVNMFSNPEDVDTMIDAIEVVQKLLKTEAFRNLNATLMEIPICEKYLKYSRKFWRCVIRQISTTSFHPCGTTAMGLDPRSSVVDRNLRVHGIGRLRVIDAGVFPTSISGHTGAPTVMVAENGADRIKRDYGYIY